MGRKKIHNRYEKRNQLVTFRLKYWEHQKLMTFSRRLDMSISDVCRMFVSQGIDNVNANLAKEGLDNNSEQWDY